MDTPTLAGRHVTLRPLSAADAADLFAVTPPDTFKHFLSWPTEWSPAGMEAWIRDYLLASGWMCFAVVRNRDGRVVGSSSFMDILPAHRHAEIGCTWYAADARGTAINPESKLLMLAHAFEAMNCIRITLKCNALNTVSRRAIAKLGAVEEGTLRRHRIQPNGVVRDTTYFSITDAEWPSVRDRLRARLASLA